MLETKIKHHLEGKRILYHMLHLKILKIFLCFPHAPSNTFSLTFFVEYIFEHYGHKHEYRNICGNRFQWLMFLYINCASHAPGVKFGYAPGVYSLHRLTMGKTKKIFFSETRRPRASGIMPLGSNLAMPRGSIVSIDLTRKTSKIQYLQSQ